MIGLHHEPGVSAFKATELASGGWVRGNLNPSRLGEGVEKLSLLTGL